MPNWKKLVVSGSDATLKSLNVETSVNAQSITGSLSYNNITDVPQGIISQSSQVDITQTSGYPTFSSSLNTEKQRIDTILLASDADKDSFAEIVSLINSVDTDNDNAFASFYTASNGRLGSLESYTASLNSTTLVSGSSQINITGTTGYTSFSSSLADSIGAISTDFADITNKPTLISSSAQIVSHLSNQDVDLGIGDITASTFTGSLLRLDENGTGLRMTNVGAFDNSSGNFRIFSNGDLILSTNGDSGTAVTFDQTTKDANFEGAITASAFKGDGSGLTNVSTSITEYTTVEEAFTNKISIAVPHNFNTKNVVVAVYDDNDAQVIPLSVITTTVNLATITFCETTSGRVVVAKGGHIVSGSIQMFTHREDLSGSTTYNITHSLDEDYPIVQLYGTDKKQVIPKDIESVSSNVVTIEFCESFDGKVVIKK